MANMFDRIAQRMRGSPIAVPMMLFIVLMVIIGIIFSIEDLKSSRDGIQAIESFFIVNPVNFEITYWALSAAPQVFQIVSGYVYVVFREEYRWAGIMWLVSFLLDFGSDVYDRSNGLVFDSANWALFWPSILVSAFLTLWAYTLMSEICITWGLALMLRMTPDALEQAAKMRNNVVQAMANARRMIDRTDNRVDQRENRGNRNRRNRENRGGNNNRSRQGRRNGDRRPGNAPRRENDSSTATPEIDLSGEWWMGGRD